MGTSIILNDVVFTNNSLPIVSNLMTDGLVAGFRPTRNKNSLVDISGNNIQATLIGSPTFEDGYMSGYFQNGFRIEAAETESVTLITVCRAGRSLERNGYICSPIFSRWDDTNNQRGCGIFLSINANKYYSNYQGWLKSANGADMVNKYGSPYVPILELSNETDETKTEWIFLATSFEASTNTIIQYIPRYDIEHRITNDDATIAGRRITNSVNGQMNRFEICSAGGYTAAKGVCDVAEALYYNKALTSAEVMEQYRLSKEFFEKNRSIVI